MAKSYYNPQLEIYKSNVSMLDEYELKLLMSTNKYEESGYKGKIKSLNKVIKDYERIFKFKKYMVK